MVHATASPVVRPTDRGTPILFIPDAQGNRTSERTPIILGMLRERHEVIGLPSPWDRIMYDPSRPMAPRAVLYVLDKGLLAWRGLPVREDVRRPLRTLTVTERGELERWLESLSPAPAR